MMHAFIPAGGRQRQVDLSLKSVWLIYRVNCNQPASNWEIKRAQTKSKLTGGTGLRFQLLVTEDRNFKDIMV